MPAAVLSHHCESYGHRQAGGTRPESSPCSRPIERATFCECDHAALFAGVKNRIGKFSTA